MSRTSSSSKAFKASSKFPAETYQYLKDWVLDPDQFDNPYPTEEQVHEICSDTNLTKKQVKQWIDNYRQRIWNNPAVQHDLAQEKKQAAFKKKKKKRRRSKKPDDDSTLDNNSDNHIEEEWISCDRCNKRRLLLPHLKPSKLPKYWICSDFPMLACDVPESPFFAKASSGKPKLKNQRQKPRSSIGDSSSNSSSQKRRRRVEASSLLFPASTQKKRRKRNFDNVDGFGFYNAPTTNNTPRKNNKQEETTPPHTKFILSSSDSAITKATPRRSGRHNPGVTTTETVSLPYSYRGNMDWDAIELCWKPKQDAPPTTTTRSSSSSSHQQQAASAKVVISTTSSLRQQQHSTSAASSLKRNLPNEKEPKVNEEFSIPDRSTSSSLFVENVSLFADNARQMLDQATNHELFGIWSVGLVVGLATLLLMPSATLSVVLAYILGTMTSNKKHNRNHN